MHIFKHLHICSSTLAYRGVYVCTTQNRGTEWADTCSIYSLSRVYNMSGQWSKWKNVISTNQFSQKNTYVFLYVKYDMSRVKCNEMNFHVINMQMLCLTRDEFTCFFFGFVFWEQERDWVCFSVLSEEINKNIISSGESTISALKHLNTQIHTFSPSMKYAVVPYRWR